MDPNTADILGDAKKVLKHCRNEWLYGFESNSYY
jgi:hypothetical protein